jgi:hypothetical protein
MGQATPSQNEAEGAASETSEAAATPAWQYQVIRFPARAPFEIKQDATRYLADELDRGAADGWEYVGLLALESHRAGYNGLVAFRRQAR